jgi:glucoamylase
LTTFAAAEQLYLALHTWSAAGSLDVTSLSQPFFAQFDPSVTAGTYAASSSTYTSLTTAIRTYADAFIAINAKYTPQGGGLAEQYSRTDGTPVSAVDLTWSYASALTAFQARAGIVSASWGAKGLTVPSTCSTGGSGGGSGGTVAVTFNVAATTVQGG